jgi:hypothetical protein
MKKASRKVVEPVPGYVHLGERLLAVGRIRAGVSTPTQVAHELGVKLEDVRQWQVHYAGDRTVGLQEFRRQGPREAWELEMRARRLADLIAETERDLRALHRELFRGMAAQEPGAAPLDATSKEVA